MTTLTNVKTIALLIMIPRETLQAMGLALGTATEILLVMATPLEITTG
jgi:hypothetical protein